jgi:methionyl aminopeptidase
MHFGALTLLARNLQHGLKSPLRQQALRFRATVTAAKFSSQTTGDHDFGNYDIILPPDPIVWGTSHIVPRTVPEHIPRPPYVKPGHIIGLNEDAEESYEGDGLIRLGSPEELKLRKAAQLAKRVREYAGTLVKVFFKIYMLEHFIKLKIQVGVTTNTIDAAVHQYIISHGSYPSPLLYSGFPRSCCTSVNNVISHGIPDEYVPSSLPHVRCSTDVCSRPLQDGDIVNIDITVYLDGYHGDTSQTFLVGNVVRDTVHNLILLLKCH